MKAMAALNKRVGLLGMTKHEFLDADRHRKRSTFADGTAVTVDWTARFPTSSSLSWRIEKSLNQQRSN